MEIKIQRTRHGPVAIMGTLTLDGAPMGATLEGAKVAIPPGVYPARLYDSPSFGRVVLLEDVPGRTWIEIHAGNTAKDTRGCILVGTEARGWTLAHSRKALRRLLDQLAGADTIRVAVIG